MAEKYTRQTPQQVRSWLDAATPTFPLDWDLNAVADESNRRWLSSRWGANVWASRSNAARAVTTWAMLKLATYRDFTEGHWGWIAAPDAYDSDVGYSRLHTILEPAIGDSGSWRHSAGEVEEDLERLRELVSELQSAINSSPRLNVMLDQVAAVVPETLPLLHRSRWLGRKQMRAGQARAKAAREAGANPMQQIAASLSGDTVYVEPRLSDYLATLTHALSPKGSSDSASANALLVNAGLVGLTDDERAALKERFGISASKLKPDKLIRTGGKFGAYPSRADALRRAVISQAPAALFERHTRPPSTTPASVIEGLCLAWFGTSPTQKEINTAIKADRATLEKKMRGRINSTLKAEARNAAMVAQGLSASEIRKQNLAAFLDDWEDDDLSDVERRVATKLKAARGGRKSTGK